MINGRIKELFEPGGLRIRFQPIVHTHPAGSFHAVECLTRGPEGTLLEMPNVLFDYVRRKRAEVPVEREVLRHVFDALEGLPTDLRVSVNLHASTLGRDADLTETLRRRAKERGFDLSRLIIEIVEHSPAWNQPAFLRALSDLRSVGVRIALDDVGLGNSNYRMILDSRPEYFKVDSYVCAGVHSDRYRRAVLKSIVGLARDFGGAVVAEGVEEIVDFNVMKELGVDYVQGYFFYKPLTIDGINRAYASATDIKGDSLAASTVL